MSINHDKDRFNSVETLVESTRNMGLILGEKWRELKEHMPEYE
jgi:hypothetical protein